IEQNIFSFVPRDRKAKNFLSLGKMGPEIVLDGKRGIGWNNFFNLIHFLRMLARDKIIDLVIRGKRRDAPKIGRKNACSRHQSQKNPPQKNVGKKPTAKSDDA